MALPISKQMGMAFLMIIWFYYLINVLAEKKNFKRNILKAIPLIVLPIGTMVLWKMYTKSLGLAGQFDLSKITDLFVIFEDKYSETVRRQTFNNYVHALFEKNISTMFFPFTYVAAFFVILVLIWLLSKWGKDQFTKRQFILLDLAFICGTLGYALTLCILYQFCFSVSEMQHLASYERYMASYVLAEVLILTYIALKIYSSNNKLSNRNIVIALAAICIITNASNLRVFIPGWIDGLTNKSDRTAANGLENIIDGNQSVFIVASDTIKSQYYINYYSNDIGVILHYTDFLNADYTNEETKANLRNAVFGYDYLYIREVNDNFNNAMSDVNGGTFFTNGEVYKVTNTGEKISLEKVGQIQ